MPIRRKKLTVKQAKLVAFLAKNPTASVREAAEACGYSSRNSAATAFNSKNVQACYRDLMEKFPNLKDAALVKKISSGLEAKEKKFFSHLGEVIAEREVDNHEIQKGYLELALKLKGINLNGRLELTGKDGAPLIDIAEWFKNESENDQPAEIPEQS